MANSKKNRKHRTTKDLLKNRPLCRSLRCIRKKGAFTLLEITISLLLLSIVGSLIGVQSVKLIRAHRFDKEVGQLLTALQEAQVLAATYSTEHVIEIGFEKGSYYYQISTDEPLPSSLLNQKKIALKQIKKILFNGQKEKSRRFEILPSGCIEPKGVLCFEEEASKQKRFIDMQGGTILKCTNQAPRKRSLKIPDPPRFL